MMKIFCLIVCTSILVAACGKKNKIPNDIMPPDKMEAIMWDMMRADQFLADYVVNKDTSKKKEEESVKLYTQVFSFHKTNREDFQKSFTYYQSHPLLLKSIMDSITTKKSEGGALPPLADTSKTAKPVLPPVNRDSMMKRFHKSMPVN